MACEGGQDAADISVSDSDPRDEFEGLRFGVDGDKFECDDLEIRQLLGQHQPLCESVEASSHHTDEAGRAVIHSRNTLQHQGPPPPKHDESQVPATQRRRTRRQRRKSSSLGKARACNCNNHDPNSSSPVPGDGAGGSPIDSSTHNFARMPEISKVIDRYSQHRAPPSTVVGWSFGYYGGRGI